VLIGKDATMKRWLARDPARYRFIHIAAHARVSDHRPELTHIVLADRGLHLSAIRRLRLQAELVTLSACETALGQRVHGEGVIGLPHAFLSAGARGTVVTLWRVEDGMAGEFMRDFYIAIHGGSTPAQALLDVRRRLLASETNQHPSRWAAFVHVGAPERR
jgi:CHAT domain-containing protein